MSVYERYSFKLSKLRALRNKNDGRSPVPALDKEVEKVTAALQKLRPVVGFSIGSMAFWSTTGAFRITSLDFNFDGVLNDSLLDSYNVQISTVAGLIKLKPYFREISAACRSGTDFPMSHLH